MKIAFVLLFIGLLGVIGCSVQSIQKSDNRLNIVATTTIIADVLHQVGGELINIEILLPPGTDPHSFSPTPQDMTKIAHADILFMNGLGLETFLESYLETTGENVHIVEVSSGIDVIIPTGADLHDEVDPHTWTDPNNVSIWVTNIAAALSDYDPGNAQSYQQAAKLYQAQLDDLDFWIRSQVDQIPIENRRIVTDHESLAYFARRYGFELIGTIIPSTSTLSEPSAEQMALLEDLIIEQNVKAIFVDSTINPNLAERIANDNNIDIKLIYSGSLTEPGGNAGTYLDYMRYNVLTIVEELKQ